MIVDNNKGLSQNTGKRQCLKCFEVAWKKTMHMSVFLFQEILGINKVT